MKEVITIEASGEQIQLIQYLDEIRKSCKDGTFNIYGRKIMETYLQDGSIPNLPNISPQHPINNRYREFYEFKTLRLEYNKLRWEIMQYYWE